MTSAITSHEQAEVEDLDATISRCFDHVARIETELRDPRKTPVAGDVLRRLEKTGVTKTVTGILDGGNIVLYHQVTNFNRAATLRCDKQSWLKLWRKWAAHADVIRRGDE